MTIDYDIRRAIASDTPTDGIDGLLAPSTAGAVSDQPEPEDHEPTEASWPDISDEELVAAVVLRRADEFTCTGCFLVQHNSRIARRVGDGALCPDCA